MRSLVKGSPCRRMKALKCWCHFESPPTCHKTFMMSWPGLLKWRQKWSPIMPLSLCCQQRMAAEDWLGWKVERGPVLKMALYPLSGISAVSLCNYLHPPALCLGLPCLHCMSCSLTVSLQGFVTLSSALPLSLLKSFTCLSWLSGPTLKEEA